MTSPASVVAPSAAGSRPTAQRRDAPSRLRRGSLWVLVVGTVLAAVAAFGPVWSVRVGVAIAVSAAVAACLLAWRELFVAQRRHAAQQLATARDHGQALREERSRNAAVVDTLNGRLHEAGSRIESQHNKIVELRGRITRLTGDRAQLTRRIEERNEEVSALRATVRAQDADLAALRQDQDQDTVRIRHMPRRVRTDPDGEILDAVDAKTLDGVDSKTFQTAMMLPKVLPNYEGERQVG